FSKLDAFEISYFAEHFRFTLFLITAIAVAGLVAFAVLSARVKAFWARVRQGVTILSDRPRYLREVASLKVFAKSAPTAVVAAYSVGQQIAIAAFTASIGLGAVFFIFRFRSFKEVIAAGRASRDAERAEERAPEEQRPPGATEGPRAPGARAGTP